jgi:hypothetical protein
MRLTTYLKVCFNSSNVHASAFRISQRAKGKIEMPFDAQLIDVSPTRKILHCSYIDSEGKDRTDSYDIPTDSAVATDADLNALTAELGALTNASLYAVGVTSWFQAAPPSKANALDATNDSVRDNVVILFKDIANNSFDLYVPANVEADTMVLGTENPDAAKLADLIAAAGAIWATFDPISLRFTERKQKNKATKL